MRRIILFLIPLLLLQLGISYGYVYSDCYTLIYPVRYSGVAYITMNTAELINSFRMKSDCSDLAVFLGDTKLSRYVMDCNTVNTKIFFRVNQSALEDKTYCIKYADWSVYEKNNITIFDFWDDFENTTRSGTIWSGTYSFSSGYNSIYSLYLTANRNAYTSRNFTLVFFNYRGTGTLTTTASYSLSSTVWTTFNATANNYISFSTGKGQELYIDNVVGIANYTQPLVIYLGRSAYGVTTIEEIAYCEGDFAVRESIVCEQTNISICRTNQTKRYCYYGCYEGECIARFWDRAINILLALVGIFVLLFIFWKLRG